MAHYYDPADETIEGGAGMRDYHRTSDRILLPDEREPTGAVIVYLLAALAFTLGVLCGVGLHRWLS